VRILALVLGILLLVPVCASAVCRKSRVCNDYGYNCQYIDVCDNSLDLPSINLPSIDLPTVNIKPLPSIGLPPLGTSKCEYMRVDGQWKNICY
jgi:hypothetical protein